LVPGSTNILEIRSRRLFEDTCILFCNFNYYFCSDFEKHFISTGD